MLTNDVNGTLDTKCLVTAKGRLFSQERFKIPFGGKVCCKRLQTVSRQWLGVWVTEMMPAMDEIDTSA